MSYGITTNSSEQSYVTEHNYEAYFGYSPCSQMVPVYSIHTMPVLVDYCSQSPPYMIILMCNNNKVSMFQSEECRLLLLDPTTQYTGRPSGAVVQRRNLLTLTLKFESRCSHAIWDFSLSNREAESDSIVSKSIFDWIFDKGKGWLDLCSRKTQGNHRSGE